MDEVQRRLAHQARSGLPSPSDLPHVPADRVGDEFPCNPDEVLDRVSATCFLGGRGCQPRKNLANRPPPARPRREDFAERLIDATHTYPPVVPPSPTPRALREVSRSGSVGLRHAPASCHLSFPSSPVWPFHVSMRPPILFLQADGPEDPPPSRRPSVGPRGRLVGVIQFHLVPRRVPPPSRAPREATARVGDGTAGGRCVSRQI